MRSDYWLYFDNPLADTWCDRIVEYAMGAYEPVDATIGFENNRPDETYRKCDIRWMDASIEKDIVNDIWHIANRANRDSFDLDLRYVNEIQYTTYYGNDETPGRYDWHHDVHWTEPKAHHRKLSLVFQLSDPSEYEGGRFEFDPNLPQLPDEAFKKGSVIVFPSVHTHRVTPVTAGTRHSLVTWVEGPHWR